MNYEELLRKLGFARCGDTQIFQIGLGGALGIHLDAIQEMTTLELREHILTQLNVLKTNLNMHIDGTAAQCKRMTAPDFAKYEGLI